MAGLPSVAGSSQAWASVGSMWSTSFNGGWLADQSIGSTGGFTVLCSPTSSGYIFTSTGDGTTGASGNGFYALGRPVRILQNSTTFYGWVKTASVGAGVTTVGLSSASASAALSTGLAFTSVAAGVATPQAMAASATPAATARFHREDGSWATPAGTGTQLVVSKYEDNVQFSTTSTSYVDITSMSISVTTSSAGNNVQLTLYGYVQPGAAANSMFRIYNSTDAAEIVPGRFVLTAAGEGGTLVIPTWTTLAASAKTIIGQLKTSASTAYIGGAISGETTRKGLVAVEYR